MKKEPDIVENIQADLSEEASEEKSGFLELEEKLAEAVKLNEEYTDKLQRSLAEFDNFRKRTIKEKAGMYADGVRDTVAKLLPVIDNFERAVNSAADKKDPLYKGIYMVFNQLGDLLKDIGVTEIDSTGFSFDPAFHNAVFHVEDTNYGENEIIEELQKGYMFKDKVIRPSMVKVAN